MTINVKFDAILGKLRESDVGAVSLASVPIPDPLIINNLQVLSTASINTLYLNSVYGSTASFGYLTTNSIYNASTISTNLINTTRTDFNTSYVANGEPVGSLYWNSDRDTVALMTNGGEIDLGEDLMFFAINQSGATIMSGTVVQFAGALGSSGKMLIAPAIADGSVPAIQILGITKETINNGDEGKVIMVGELRGVDTSVFGTAGQVLYIDPATPGGLTNTEPTAPNLRYPIAATLDSSSNGNIIIRAIYNPNLKELNDVSFTSLASGNLMLSNASGVWFNYSASSLVNSLVSYASLGSLAVQNTVDYATQITGLPSLGSLAVQNSIIHSSTTSLLNDDHTQYLLLAGRGGGQTVIGNTTFSNQLILANASTTNNYTLETLSTGNIDFRSLATSGTQVLSFKRIDELNFNVGANSDRFKIYDSTGNAQIEHIGGYALTGQMNIIGDLFVQNSGGTFVASFSSVFENFEMTKNKELDDLAQVGIGMVHYRNDGTNDVDLVAGDLIGRFFFSGYVDGVGVIEMANMQGVVRTADSADIAFNATDAGTLSEVMRIGDPSGNPRIAVNSTALTAAMLYLFQNNTVNALPVIRLQQSDLSEEYFDFRTTVNTGNPVNTTALGTYYGRVRVAVNGTTRWLALYNT